MRRRTFLQNGLAAGWGLPLFAALRQERLDESGDVLNRAVASGQVAAAGRFHNVGFSDEVAGGDREHLLPLLRRLQDELGLKTYALLEDPAEAEAWIVLVQLPPDEPSREQVRAAIAEADLKFPGVFFETWGRVWLELDMLGPQTAKRLGMQGR